MSKKTHIALVALSNPLSKEKDKEVDQLIEILHQLNFKTTKGQFIFEKEYNSLLSAKQKASELNDFFSDDTIDYIFDISGGDRANEVLPYLDYSVISNSNAIFSGYSDLSTVLNAIFTKANQNTVLYQIMNLIRDDSGQQKRWFEQTFLNKQTTLFDFNYKFVNGESIEGEIIGGNIRCFLKLAGTPYWPNMKNKVLLLEANSGDVNKIVTYLNQLDQLGVFTQINGILLGSFTEMEQEKYLPKVEKLLQDIVPIGLPIVKTNEIGHQSLSKAIQLGKYLEL